MDVGRTGPSAETIDTPRHRALASATRVAILHLVRRSPDGLTAGEVARAAGRHLTTVREHLDRLAEAGLLVRERHRGGSPGRPAWRYRAGAAPDTAAGPFRELAEALVEHIATTEDDPWAAGMAVGRGWGRKLATGTGPVGGAQAGEHLMAVLERLGFAPRVMRRHGPDDTVIHLLSCPFLDLVETSPDVVCGLHLGVVKGALGAAGAPGTAAALEPFGTAGACVLRLRPSGARDLDDQPEPPR